MRNQIKDDIQKDIETLLSEARLKLIEADKNGDTISFQEIAYQYGPIAHRIYLSLDAPERAVEKYHNPETHRVMLDACTVSNRTRNCQGSTIDDVEFWLHGDMIKALCDYLARLDVYACA